MGLRGVLANETGLGKVVQSAWIRSSYLRVRPELESRGTLSTSVNKGLSIAMISDVNKNPTAMTEMFVPVPNSLTSADENFRARCAQPSVLNCQGFDSILTFKTLVNTGAMTDGFNYINATHVKRDTTTFLSGGSSANFSIPSGAGVNGPGANWWAFFGQGTKNKRFGNNTTFYVQFAFRADSAWTSTNWTKYGCPGCKTAPKIAIFHSVNSGACASQEITTHNHNAMNLPTIYTECGNRAAYTGADGMDYSEGGPEIYLQQGWKAPAPFTGYQTEYNFGGSGASAGPKAFHFMSNQWYTIYYKIHVGTLAPSGGPPVLDSSIEAWIAPYGQPMRKWVDVRKFPLFNDPPGNCDNLSPCPPYNVLELTQFMTGKNSNDGSPEANVWYDELIISTQPIQAPFGPTP